MKKPQEWPLDKILPYDNNAKLHDLPIIKKSIAEYDIDQPIVVDADSVIIKGHGRLKAARELGLKTFPVIVRDDLTAEQVRLSRLLDNRSAEGGYDAEKLESEIQAILEAEPEIDLDEYGLTDEWLHKIQVTTASDIDIDDLFVDDTGPEREKKPVIMTCPHCGESFEA